MIKKKPKLNTKIFIKSYKVKQFGNFKKKSKLIDLYETYKSEYKFHVLRYWDLFTQNKISRNTFSHLGSTKHISTNLSASLLQGCLNQACASLNNYTANIKNKFSEIINKSSIKDENILHALRTINLNRAWLNEEVYVYGKSYYIDDFGNQIISDKLSQFCDDFGNLNKTANYQYLIDKVYRKWAVKVYKRIISKRVRFPNLEVPRLILDDRLYSILPSKTSTFDCWLNVATLTPNNRVSIPIKTNKHFDKAIGIRGNTIEMMIRDNELSFILNKKEEFNLDTVDKSKLSKVVGFDVGLSNLLATSDGQLLGKNFIEKLSYYDKKLNYIYSGRQIALTNYNKAQPKNKRISLKSKRYRQLVETIRGFIKSEVNRVLNKYFEDNTNIDTVVIESLNFNNPNLSKRLNRLIKNFGQKIFNDKLEELSTRLGFSIEERNPAYSSQECNKCGYVESNNRKIQKEFICKCCKTKIHADVNASKVICKRFMDKKDYAKVKQSKGRTLIELKERFVVKIPTLLNNGIIGRRKLLDLLSENKYFKRDLESIAITTKTLGLESMTVQTFEVFLRDYFKTKDKIKPIFNGAVQSSFMASITKNG